MRRAAITFPAAMTPTEADALAVLMEEGRPTRPEGVLAAFLRYEDGVGTLTAVWQDAATLDAYLAVTEVPRGKELMRRIGLEPEIARYELLDFG
jgi:hypothetical protein